MTAEHFEKTLGTFVSRQPFRAFTIELNTGQRYEIDHPFLSLAFHEGEVIFFAPGGIPVVFDHESVNQVIYSPAHAAPGKRRSK